MHDHIVVTADGASVPRGTRIAPTRFAEAPSPRVAWLDVTEGVAGDMLLGALLDAGADAGSVACAVEAVAPGRIHLQTRRVIRGAFAATKVDVIADETDPPARHLADIEEMIASAALPERTRDLALATFALIADAEAHAHGASVNTIHFHEVGALDSIGDIVGVAEAWRTLGVTAASASRIALGAGHVHAAHGTLTVPPPAVAYLATGWETEAGGPESVGELTTPTGMALVRVLASSQGALPPMRVCAQGFGAGTRVRCDRAGLTRILIGEPAPHPHPSPPRGDDTRVCEIRANVDDLDPRAWPAALERLLAGGARDAWLTPILMKKGRPAHTLSVLAPPDLVDDLAAIVFAHTSTLGVRIGAPQRRLTLARRHVPVDVDGQRIRVTVAAAHPGEPLLRIQPEYEDLATAATALNVGIPEVLDRARVACAARGLVPGAPWPAGGETDD